MSQGTRPPLQSEENTVFTWSCVIIEGAGAVLLGLQRSAIEAYKSFDQRKAGWVKVLLETPKSEEATTGASF